MSRKLTKIALIAAVTVSLSGCAQITKLGDNMWGHTKNAWGYTKSAANFVASPVTKMLRSAPEPRYVFEDASRAQNMAKQAFNSDDAGAYANEIYAPHSADLPAPQTPHYQASVNTPRRYHSEYDDVSVAPRRVVQAQPHTQNSTPQTSTEISFVKMGGGSDMQDWISCEAEAGAILHIVSGGYLIDSGFEGCMRAKGYKPESEVADALSL